MLLIKIVTTLSTYIYHVTKFGGLMVYGSKDIFKNAPYVMN